MLIILIANEMFNFELLNGKTDAGIFNILDNFSSSDKESDNSLSSLYKEM